MHPQRFCTMTREEDLIGKPGNSNNTMRTKLSLLLLICALSLFAGDIERVSATYEYFSNNPNETPAQAETAAIERANQKKDPSMVVRTTIISIRK